MNPTKNYNAYPRWSIPPKLVTPIPSKLPGQMLSYVPRRLKAEKLRDAKQFKKLGTEENFNGYCNRCELPRTFARKSPSNVHYNCCKQKCCIMLHQWDVCNYCLTDMHGSKLTQDDQRRQDEVARFHNVFVELPDDIKKYIGEFVPLIFNYVEKVSRLVFIDRKMANLDQYLTCPKTTWKSVAEIFAKKYHLKNPINKTSSRQKICNAVKELYARQYSMYHTSLIEETDYWTHRNSYLQVRNSTCELIGELEKVKLLL